jgi:Mrp family chromosome partitioning ATPase
MRTLLFANPAAPPPKVILVTSARPGEGKTVASLNLASALAELGARTLLIDADLRHPRCHTALGVEDEDGLSSWLADRSSSTR